MNENTSKEEFPVGTEVEGVHDENSQDDIDINDLIGAGNESFGYPQPKKIPIPAVTPKVETPVKPEEKTADNDEVRYQYFQSAYDKEKAKTAELERKLELAQARPQVSAPQPVAPQPIPVAPVDTPDATLPEAPVMPIKPAYFNAAELSDPASDSFRYQMEMDTWRNNMLLHNQKLVELSTAQNQKKIDEMLAKQESDNQQRIAMQEQQRQLQSLQSELKTKFGATDEQTVEFIQEMSNPNSISLDNLWNLYANEHKLTVQDTTPVTTPVAPEPSAAFKQAEQVQGVPLSMGTIPGKTGLPKKSAEDIIMDKMLDMQKNEDPFFGSDI